MNLAHTYKLHVLIYPVFPKKTVSHKLREDYDDALLWLEFYQDMFTISENQSADGNTTRGICVAKKHSCPHL